MLMIWDFVGQLATAYPAGKRPSALHIFSPQGVDNPALSEGRCKNDQRIALASVDYLEMLFRVKLDLPANNFNLPYELVI
jgi:hypothetical protein